MKTYLLTSTKFTGHVVFQFDNAGYLVRYDITDADLNDEQKLFILKKLPRHIDLIKKMLGASRTLKLQLQKTVNTTFDMFWDKYDSKARSSKKKTQAIWNRLSQTQRDRAYNYIDTYEHNRPPAIAKKYAETYLHAELWNN